ncbi:cell division protein [Planoprotostelium fungivorum]|uniref:Cell division protein n=1 Tax=Planoprotostelium fungivorum TaxID=1890364 RepID=A0A2P6NZF8_9EUKA|nr:cell division protein [Planoprotostelium fungivorum]
MNTQNLNNTTNMPVKSEVIVKDTVVREHIHPVEKEEIQPVIHREREQLEVKQVTQKLHETTIEPTLIEKGQLPAEYREAVIEKAAPLPENVILPSRDVDATLRTQVVHQPIVNEIVKKTVIEEIQPVLEKDIIAPTIIQETQPIYEKIIEAPIVTREVREVQELGTRSASHTAPIVEEKIVIVETETPIVAPSAPLVDVLPAVKEVPIQPIGQQVPLQAAPPVVLLTARGLKKI